MDARCHDKSPNKQTDEKITIKKNNNNNKSWQTGCAQSQEVSQTFNKKRPGKMDGAVLGLPQNKIKKNSQKKNLQNGYVES